jgi:endonuclease III
MAKESKAEKTKRARKILAILRKHYPDAHCSLEHGNAFQLLVATILSAQCTDARVNIVTPRLFARFNTPEDFALADVTELEELIHSTGFYRNKAKNIQGMAKALLELHGGEVPRTLEELTALPGVGRKTANVILGNVFGAPALVVDTHVTRLSNLLELAKGIDAVKLEFQLMEVVDKEDWTDLAHLLISHGREICVARSPKCPQCPLLKLCPAGQKLTKPTGRAGRGSGTSSRG